ncbi:MAG: glycoside hydrolase family 5 protein [Mangrovibacterium sp.]
MNKLTAIVLLFFSFQLQAKTDSPSDFILGKGTNLAHWLSQSRQRGAEREKFIQEDDIRQIASMGFDHVRLPIDEEQMWDENGKRHEDAFQLMTNCLDWCVKYKLRAIVDLHILRSHHFNAKEKPLWTDPKEQQKFCDLWLDLSSALKHYPLSMAAYELMNEAVADDPDDWNRLLAKCFSALRKAEPERLIVIGSNRWQSAGTFDVLKVPDDPNIILSYHFYEPFLLTHYHASWTDLKNYRGPVHYPGIVLTQEEFNALPDDQKNQVHRFVNKPFNKNTMLDMMRLPIERAKELKLRLYCGEYGIVSDAPEADRLRWYADMTEIFREQGIGSANWNYKSDQFGLINNDGSKNVKLIQIVSGK